MEKEGPMPVVVVELLRPRKLSSRPIVWQNGASVQREPEPVEAGAGAVAAVEVEGSVLEMGREGEEQDPEPAAALSRSEPAT